MSSRSRLAAVVAALVGGALCALAACGSDDVMPLLPDDGGSADVSVPDAGALATFDAWAPDAFACQCVTPRIRNVTAALECGDSLCVSGVNGSGVPVEYHCDETGDGGYADPPVDCLDASTSCSADGGPC